MVDAEALILLPALAQAVALVVAQVLPVVLIQAVLALLDKVTLVEASITAKVIKLLAEAVQAPLEPVFLVMVVMVVPEVLEQHGPTAQPTPVVVAVLGILALAVLEVQAVAEREVHTALM